MWDRAFFIAAKPSDPRRKWMWNASTDRKGEDGKFISIREEHREKFLEYMVCYSNKDLMFIIIELFSVVNIAMSGFRGRNKGLAIRCR
jgi:hypothetical protein